MTTDQAEAAYPDCLPRIRRGPEVDRIKAAIVAHMPPMPIASTPSPDAPAPRKMNKMMRQASEQPPD